MKVKILAGVFLSAFSSFVSAQNSESFDSPLNISIHASGNFGELRGTHFHTGLDIKTQQRIGLPVYAPADGFVSRIKVSTWGYGKALYIDHPNGQTTVYGHLDSYAGDIGSLVLNRHYAEKNFEIEIFPKKNELTVKKGQIIAYTGNTGGSGGPHLHYEIRDTKTQNIINPLKEGMSKLLTDTQAPTINGLYVYPVGDNAVANESESPSQLSYITQKDGTLLSSGVKASGDISFGIDIHDTANFNTNKNGVYMVETSVNGKALFSYKFDSFSFSETGYVNALIDYERYLSTKKKVQKLFFEKPYSLSVLSVDVNKGVFNIKSGENYNYTVVLSDYHGNKTTIVIPVEHSSATAKTKKVKPKGEFKINSDRDYIFERKNVTVSIPIKTFYNDFLMDMSVEDDVLKLHKPIVPLAKSLLITFDTSTMNISNRDKAFIGRVDGGKRDYFRTAKKGNIWTIYAKSFGDYKILIDEKAPTIEKPSFTEGQWLSTASEISFIVRDDMSGISTINGYINGNWILLDYDYKTRKIIHKFSDNKVVSGRNDVIIKVKDNVGNEGIFESHFFRE
ncbi:M23 family metallopeptidase [Myroides sp. M-43]|uniref:M23 family metallopeptidase n=1 Tax=Myroides oncorhynchi TaxID=2893756 RepID=UPI001E2ED9D6|nr:M23 family metallopeptidase [Myroides oncorhynchi]MCC9042977.1 M23 family metallopeptidase [Myroides oncorhynchi]